MKKIKFTFSHRIIAGFAIMAVLSVLIGYLAFITTGNLQKISSAIMKENVSSLKAAEELEIALLNQKGLVSNYLLDGNFAWLKTLEEKKKDFDTWFKNAQSVALTESEKRILRDIFNMYKIYDNQRNRAIKLYQANNVLDARRILANDMKNSVDSLYQKCEDLLLVNEMLIAKAETSSKKNVFRMTAIIWLTIIGTLCLGGIMGFFIARKINEELVRSAKMASLGQLSATVAHEIRNPLTAIKMRLYSLQDQVKSNTDSKEDMLIINEEINRLEKIIKNFLDFARPPELKLEVCDISNVLQSVINLVKSKAESSNIRIENRIEASLPGIKVDKEQMRQVFLNIMLNAIDVMPKGGIIELKASFNGHNKKQNGLLKVEIKDTGQGMDPDLKNKLFEPFITTKEQGTGLGLFIASRIVKLHKGDIVVDSAPGKGTIVTVGLPISYKADKKIEVS
jgi:signal transduction histidine kinase